MAQNDAELVELIVILVFVAIAMVVGLGIQAFICWLTSKTAAAIPPRATSTRPDNITTATAARALPYGIA